MPTNLMQNNFLSSQAQSYLNRLEELDISKSEELISNSNADHAKSLIYRLIIGAKESINIISTNLSLYTNDTIISALKMALNRGVKVKLLLDDYPNSGLDKSNEFLKVCLEKKENCDVRTYKKQLNAHIITRDDSAFRYCEKLGSHTAIASFNDTKTVSNSNSKVFKESGFFKDLDLLAF